MNSVKELRHLTGLSQSEFAEKYHMSKFTLQQWEQERFNTPECILYLLNRVIKELDYK